MIIGITGYYGSGKDSVAKYLESKGFIHHSLSNEIKVELEKKEVIVTRDNLINLGNELRLEFGPNILARRIIQRLDPAKNYIITSIRNPFEALELKKIENFKLITLDGPIEQRFERMKGRGQYEEEPKTIEELREKEKIEESSDLSKQQLHKVRELADIKINNNSTLANLYDQIDNILLNNSYK